MDRRRPAVLARWPRKCRAAGGVAPSPGLGRGAPGGIERPLVERQQPTGGYTLAAELVETDRRPAPVATAEPCGAFGQDRHARPVADEHVAGEHPEAPRRQLAAAGEVVHHGGQAFVATRYRVVAGNVPADVLRQQRAQVVGRPAGIERPLRVMKTAQQLDGHTPVHAPHGTRSAPPEPPVTDRAESPIAVVVVRDLEPGTAAPGANGRREERD